jgi:hypothetical protein
MSQSCITIFALSRGPGHSWSCIKIGLSSKMILIITAPAPRHMYKSNITISVPPPPQWGCSCMCIKPNAVEPEQESQWPESLFCENIFWRPVKKICDQLRSDHIFPHFSKGYIKSFITVPKSIHLTVPHASFFPLEINAKINMYSNKYLF